MILEYFKKIDLPLFLSAVFLTILGLISIYSSSFRNNDFSNFYKQIFFLALGLILMFFVSLFDYRILKDNPYLILILYFLSLLLLLGVLFFGKEIRGTKSWYSIGGFSFQPTSFVKIVLIILFAKFFSTRHVELYKITHILHSALYLFLVAFLILLQPDLGFVIILVLSWIGILLVSGIKLRHFVLLSLFFLFVFIYSWNFMLLPYQKNRIISFLFSKEPLGISWSQIQAKIAIGSSGFLGKGIKKGTQVQLLFLTEPQTDFVFSAIAEEMGFLTVFLLFLLFFLLLFRCFKIYSQTNFNFGRLIIAGTIITWFCQVFINLSMNLGLFPIIGIPLPFVSYGGSDLLANYILLGIIQNIKMSC
jgi:rod shape determining protein RodA